MDAFIMKECKEMFHWCSNCPPMKISAAQWALAGSCLFTIICLLVQVADYHVGLFSHDVFLTFKIFYLALLCVSLLSTSCSLFASRRPFSTSDPLSSTENQASSSILNFLTQCGCNGLFPRRFVLLIASVLFSLIALAISLTPGTHHDQEDHLAAKQILQVLQTLTVGISVFLNVRAWLHAQNWDKLSLDTTFGSTVQSPESTFNHMADHEPSIGTNNTVVSLAMPKLRASSHTTLEKKEQNTQSNHDGGSMVQEQCVTIHELHANTLVSTDKEGKSTDPSLIIEDMPNKSNLAQLSSIGINEESHGKSSDPNETENKTTKEIPKINNELDIHSVENKDNNFSPNTSVTIQPKIGNAKILPSISKEEPEVKLPHNKPRKVTESYVMNQTENLAEKYKLPVLAGTSTLYRYSDNTYVVKVLHENIPQEMFNNEIRFFNYPDFFNSPYLVKLKFFAGSKSKKKYLISEHISPGKDLNKWLYTSRKKLSAIDRFNILVGISEGLALINNHDIIHNDIKPGNIIIAENRNPKILDFSSIQPTPQCTLIQTCDEILGTASYMGPERLSNKEEEPTTKSDTFSFGVILLEVLTGRDPSKYHDDDDLPTWVSLYKESGQPLRGLVDPKTDGGWSQVETSVIEGLVDIGLSCTNSRPQLRPDMQEVANKVCQILQP